MNVNTESDEFKEMVKRILKTSGKVVKKFTPAERFLYRANVEKDMGVFFSSLKFIEFGEERATIKDFKIDSRWDGTDFLSVEATLKCVSTFGHEFEILVNVDRKNLQ